MAAKHKPMMSSLFRYFALAVLLSACASADRAMPTHQTSAEMQDIAQICVDRTVSFKARGQKLVNLGYRRIKGEAPSWVQAQIAHIAMSEIRDEERLNPERVRRTYERLRKSAAEGTLFLTDVNADQFANGDNTMIISLTEIRNELACSVAFATGTPVWGSANMVADTHPSLGTFARGTLSKQIDISHSVLGPVWKDWLKPRALVSGFSILRENK